ncbi:MAG TPA: hypothetical protein VK403_06040, partial [Allosphingosinicella sp.]|nr:hypothetical protein [Allosphingosinicella sp.]
MKGTFAGRGCSGPVIPAEAGIRRAAVPVSRSGLDSRARANDGGGLPCHFGVLWLQGRTTFPRGWSEPATSQGITEMKNGAHPDYHMIKVQMTDG